MTKANIQDQRREYSLFTLDEKNLIDNPFAVFEQWYEKAMQSNIKDHNSMVLSTVSSEGRPSSRVVLLKGFDENGFVFYTNYNSKKGKDIASKPWAAINFYWPDLERQVRIEGKVEKVSAEESDKYFQSRPKGSQIGAWVSDQSASIKNREDLDKKAQELEAEYQGKAIPRPPHWGGYMLKPAMIEFWQGRANRLHDRFAYTLQKDGKWKAERLAP